MVAIHRSTPSKPPTTLSQILKFILIISSAFMLLKLLSIISCSKSPIAVVSSESMEPAFYRGDVIFVWNREPIFDVGDIAVCWFEGRKLPMVHRIIQKRILPIKADSDGNSTRERQSTQHEYEYLTKGDNNSDDDTTLYPEGQPYLFRHDIVGVVYGYVPKIGYLTLILNDYPWLKNMLIGGIVLAAYFKRNGDQDTAQQQQQNRKEVCSTLDKSPQTGSKSRIV
ncbi:Signal peptidase complex catalytic subunit [Mycoblastus sanguinarius]|nr:Signal peptidase complex catalytic subunit [Mycoblastus sanguinarius]